MTREEAIWYLTPIAESASLERYKEALSMAVAALREQEERQWIPVEKRLPEKYQTVVGWCKDNPFSKYTEAIVCWNGKGWVFLYAQRYVANVTHWMPLPEPPKEDA